MQARRIVAVALEAKSSLDFLHHLFELSRNRQLFVIGDRARSAEFQSAGIDVSEWLPTSAGGGWFAERHDLLHDDTPAQVTFTSGTEGKPKGILLTHGNLSDVSERLIAAMALTSEIREYVGVPVTMSFGLARIRAISAVGGAAYLPPRGFDPAELARMLGSGEVNALSAVPTLLRVLLGASDVLRDHGAKLRWLEIGSQYMSAAEKRAVGKLFPNAKIVQHYGLTEASRSTFLTISDAPDAVLESVGRAVGKADVGISPDGRIKVRGPHVARWRIEGGELLESLDADGWLQTNDLGHVEDGYLYYDGRADDQMNVGGVKLSPDRVEALIRERYRAAGKLAVARVPDAMRGDGVLVAFDHEVPDLDEARRVALDVLKSLGVDAASSLHVWSTSEFPVTPTGKVTRRELTQRFIATRDTKAPKVVAASPEAEGEVAPEIAAMFGKFFPGRRVTSRDSFETLGGDSLNYIQFSLEFEKRFGALPSNWQSMTVSQINALTGRECLGFWRQLDTATLTRAFFMVCIVALHLDAFVYSSNWGAAYFLYMLAGYSLVRFQWPEIERTGNVANLLYTAVRIAVPTIAVVAWMQLWAHKFEVTPLLLISNFIDAEQPRVAYYYFAEIYIQLILGGALLFAFPAFRRVFAAQPVLVAAFLAAIAYVDGEMVERFWDTNYLYHRSPHWYAWTFAAGMLMAAARSAGARAFAMAVIAMLVVKHFGLSSATAYVAGACALLIFVPSVPVPAPVKLAVGEIASASMFMYLSHYQVKSIVTKLGHGPAPWTALVLAIVFGIVFARAYGWFESIAISRLRKVRLQFAENRRTV
jgi:acyl-coenzyme A synthetase/AMP-(fatty) acid ligase